MNPVLALPESVSDTNAMPCPRCLTLRARGPYVPRPELAKKPLGEFLTDRKTGKPYALGHKFHGVRSGTPVAPADVLCDCGAKLRHTVPIFSVDVFGWHWSIL